MLVDVCKQVLFFTETVKGILTRDPPLIIISAHSSTASSTSSTMTTILLGVGGIWSDRMKQKYDTRKQDKLEYERRFEELKAENAKRQSFIDSLHQNTAFADFDPKTSHQTRSRPIGDPMQRPPSYEVAVATADSDYSRSYATSRTSSTDSGRHGH